MPRWELPLRTPRGRLKRRFWDVVNEDFRVVGMTEDCGDPLRGLLKR